MTEQMAIEETIKEAEESAEANRLEALEYRKHGDINARHIEELSMKLSEQYGNVAMWLKELIQYRAIGTVEELQALKENEHKCEECAGCTAWLCDCSHERTKAIEEFRKEIRDWQIDIQDNEYDADKYDFVFERIYEIAESMKGEKE